MIHALLLAAVTSTAAFHALVDEEWEARLSEEPLLATSVGDHRYDDRLPSVAPADLQRAADRRRTTRQRLQAIDRAGLDVPDRISYDMLARELQDDVADHEFGRWQLPINADTGFHTGFAELPRHMTFTSTRDYQNYIARLTRSNIRTGIDPRLRGAEDNPGREAAIAPQPRGTIPASSSSIDL